jgi:esterase/lipase superfamily enzyme
MPAEFSIVGAFADATQMTEPAAAEVLAQVAAAIWDVATKSGASNDRRRMLNLVRALAAGDPSALERLATALPYPEAKARSYLEHAARAFITQSEVDAAEGLEPVNSVWVEVNKARPKPTSAEPPPTGGGEGEDSPFAAGIVYRSSVESGPYSFPPADLPVPPPAYAPAPAPPMKSGGGLFGRIVRGFSWPGRVGTSPEGDGALPGGAVPFDWKEFGVAREAPPVEAPDGHVGWFEAFDTAAAAADAPAADAPAELDADEFRVWFGTNRKPLAGDQPRFGNMRNSEVSYGYCDVYVPQSHKIGSLGSSFIRRLVTWTDDRLKLRRTCQVGADAYWALLQAQLAATADGRRHAVVFIHGYNVAFEEAALRAAQIGVDLGIEGAMAFFSWPSKGTVGGYQADQSTIEASEPAITQFLVDFARRSGADAVHVIAHSMGNRGVLRAVSRIVEDAQQRSGVEFANFILAAPDVDAETFANLAKAYVELGKRTTLYVSRTDLAVGLSTWLSQYPRVGYAPPVTVLEGIDTINVTNVDVTLLGHGYVADARPVLNDMHSLIFEGAPPGERFGLRPATTAAGQAYWEVGA